MKKLRKKRKHTLTIIFMFTFFTISGYALLSETINITGTAKNSDYFTNNKLQLSLTQTSGKYTTGTFGGLTWSSESYDGINNLSTYFVTANNTTANRANKYTITFTNPYSINLTNGTITTQLISGTFSARSATISRTTMTPNQSATATLSMTHKNRTVGNAQVLVTISFRLNGVTKYFYFTVFIN